MEASNPSVVATPYDNPFYLHNSDHAGLALVTDRLTSGAEFHSWRRSVRMALNVRNKLGFIDGTILKPSDNHRDSGAWSRCNDMVSTWLMNSVSKKIGQSLLFMSSAESMWKNLMCRFKQDDALRIYEIEQKLSTIQQGSLDVSMYYTELITLWEEYQNYVDLPVCTYGKCECHAAASWDQLQQKSRVMKFLMGLNESYDSTRRHILMLKPIPSLEEVFNMVTQDERQKNIKPITKVDNVVFQNSVSEAEVAGYAGPTENMAYAVNNNYRGKPRPICTHCGIAGHIVQKCFKIHGYPPGHRYHNATSQRTSSAVGSYSNRTTQSKPNQSSAGSYSRNNNVANVSVASSPTPHTTLDLSSFHPDQVQHLIQQLQSLARVPDSGSSQSIAQSSITDKGVMAVQSSSGTFPFPSTSLRYENYTLTFQHQALTSLSDHIPNGSWIIDSGATTHVCSDLALFSTVTNVAGVTVSLPNGTREPITHTGTVHLSNSLVLHDVLHVPSFRFNLLSVSSLLHRDHHSAHFFFDSCFIQEHTQDLMIGRGSMMHNLYILDRDIASSSNLRFCGSLKVDGYLWHQRLGHPSSAKLQHLSPQIRLDKSSSHDMVSCPVCPLAKQKKLPFPSHNHMSSAPFDLVHMDVWGPFAVESVEGYKYFLTIVDDHTRVTWLYMLKSKSDVSLILPSFVSLVRTQYKANIKMIRSDNAPELAFSNLIREHGILHQFSCAYTPQQNSVVERKHQHLLNVARALMFQSNMPLSYWSDCVLTAVFLINRTPSLLLNKISPYEKLTGKRPDYHFLRSFGCLCYVSTLDKDRHKFKLRDKTCIFLGYK